MTGKNGYVRMVRRAQSDADFKAKLLDDPAGAMSEMGATIPPGVSVKVVENSVDTMYVVLPHVPEGGVSEDELESLTGGHGVGCYPPTTNQ